MRELKIKKATPMSNYVLLTAERYTVKELTDMHGGLLPSGMTDQLKLYQKIIAISPEIRNPPYKVGDLVLINIDRYGIPIQTKDSIKSSMDEHYKVNVRYEIPIMEIDGKECLKLGNNDIEIILDDYEFVEFKQPTIIDAPKSNIIVPGKNIIIN